MRRTTASRTAFFLVACLVSSATAFENFEARERKKELKAAANEIRRRLQSTSPEEYNAFGVEEVGCAACEAVARSVEAKMQYGGGKHKATVDRLSLLYEACENIDEQIPSTMPPVKEGNPKALHFFASASLKQEIAKLKKQGKYAFDAAKGLTEYCTVLVEGHEENLSSVMAEATEALQGMFELKVKICVETTKQCTDDQLNRISEHRIAMAGPEAAKLLQAFAKGGKLPKAEL